MGGERSPAVFKYTPTLSRLEKEEDAVKCMLSFLAVLKKDPEKSTKSLCKGKPDLQVVNKDGLERKNKLHQAKEWLLWTGIWRFIVFLRGSIIHA